MEQITASVSRSVILNALAEAEKAFEAAKDARYEAMITNLMTYRSWFSTRTRTRDEAVAYFNGLGWDATSVEGYWEYHHAKSDLRRVREIREAVDNNVSDIRLPERDLRLLQAFL